MHETKINPSKDNINSSNVGVRPIAQVTDSRYKGLGGWLILVIVSLFTATGLQLFGVYSIIRLFTNGTVAFLSDSSSQFYIGGYSSILKFELIVGIIFLAAVLYLIYLFFRKNKKFPKLYIYLLIASVVYVVLDYIAASSLSVSTQEAKQILDEALSEQGTEIGRTIISALIWGSYMRKSKRVKATFVEE